MFMVAGIIFALAVLKIIQESTVSALLGAVATGSLSLPSQSARKRPMPDNRAEVAIRTSKGN